MGFSSYVKTYTEHHNPQLKQYLLNTRVHACVYVQAQLAGGGGSVGTVQMSGN